MTDGIVLAGMGDDLVELNAAPYDSEAILQQLLARHPGLLAGAQMTPDAPRRWLLISREVSVPSDADGAARWSLDHLFLDQEAIPTLVEVKRSSDSRIRREVVGQMLDYAANGVAYWPVDRLQSRFETNCESRGDDPEMVLSEFLGSDGDPVQFWQQVKTNLQAGRIRLIFLADEIPPELSRVVEFLNDQMDPAQVLAIEVKQYRGGGMHSFIPRLIGQTEHSKQRKAASPTAVRWDEDSFFQRLTQDHGDDLARVAREVLDWAKANGAQIGFGKGSTAGSLIPTLRAHGEEYYPLALWTYGRIEVQFQYLKNKPPFDVETERLEFAARLNKIPGVEITADATTKRPSIAMDLLASSSGMGAFVAALEWFVAKIRSSGHEESG